MALASEAEPAGVASAALADAFDDRGVSPRERRLAAAGRRTATTVGKGHGRLEKRTPLTATTAATATAATTAATALSGGCVDWPHLGQCSQLVRERTVVGGKTTTETAYGITSLKRAQADAGRLLKLVRSHWSIESIFWVRDVVLGEDACHASVGAGPLILSGLRNAAIALLDQGGACNKAAALRRLAAHPEEALALVKGGSG